MFTRLLAAPAVLAAAALTATPAAAVDLPMTRPAPMEAAVEAPSHYGPYVGIGGGWGWGRGHHGRHRRGSSAGDILTGVLILGTIAAVANAASKAQQRRAYPDRYPYPERYPYPDRRNDYRPDGPQGLEGAADLCLREVERNARAREVTRVERNASGWLVTGEMADGAPFSCSIGADGRIESVDVGGRARELGLDEREYDEERERSARAEVDGSMDTGAEAGPRPAYPGGPLPGEDVDGADEDDPEI